MTSRADPSAAGRGQPGLWRKVGGDLWRFFTSIRLGIVLIALIAAVGLVGTFFPQADKTRSVDYIARYGVEAYDWIRALQLDQVFSSTYFVFLMSVFFLNMSACTVKRLRASTRYVRQPQRPKAPQAFARMPVHAAAAGDEAALERARSVLRRRRYRVRRVGDQLLAEKWRWERFGIDVFHVGILVLLVGGLLTATLGYRWFEVAQLGDTFSPPNRDFLVRVDDFWSENYAESERVMDWHTTLTVLEDGREAVTRTIQVNAPLYYKGVRLYQSSFGQDWENGAHVTVGVEDAQGASLGEYEAAVGQRFPLADSGLEVQVGAFLPDFALSDNPSDPGNPERYIAYSRSQRLDNPAVFLLVYDAQGTLVHRTWALSQQPWLQRVASNAPYRFFLNGMNAPKFTGIQVNYDPGMNVALAGFGLMMLGILVHLYFKHRQVWVHLDRAGGALLLGGRVRHHARGFEIEFARIAAHIRGPAAEAAR